MNPDEQSQPGQDSKPTTPTLNTPPVGDAQQPDEYQAPTTTSTTPAGGAQPSGMPPEQDQILSRPATPADSTPGIPPASNPGTNPGAYGQGTMQPETPPTMPTMPSKPMDKRKTGLILLLVVIVALAAVAFLLVQAFSG